LLLLLVAVIPTLSVLLLLLALCCNSCAALKSRRESPSRLGQVVLVLVPRFWFARAVVVVRRAVAGRDPLAW
jgi:hypothetical protein